MLYDNFIFDIPKMMDLCVLFGPTNSTLIGKMFTNIFSHQPKYRFDLEETAKSLDQVGSFFFLFFLVVQLRIFIYLVLSLQQYRYIFFVQVFHLILGQLGLDNNQAAGSVHCGPLSSEELSELVMYVLDIAATLWYFVDIYPAATVILIEANVQNQ